LNLFYLISPPAILPKTVKIRHFARKIWSLVSGFWLLVSGHPASPCGLRRAGWLLVSGCSSPASVASSALRGENQTIPKSKTAVICTVSFLCHPNLKRRKSGNGVKDV